MNLGEALAKLKNLGSAQTRKTYGRHGVTGKMYGVRYGDLAGLVKQIGRDHDLALRLWESGNHDARVLAMKVADPEQLSARVLRGWMKAVDNHVLVYELADLAARSAAGRKLMPTWMGSRSEWPAATGWMMVARVASIPDGLAPGEGRRLLAAIEKQIHSSKNRVKYSMNTAMIAIGSYVPGLEEHAVKVAHRIGQVEVDHGLTGCKTPLAAPYIRKAAAAHRARLAKAKKKAAGRKAPRGARGAAAR